MTDKLQTQPYKGSRDFYPKDMQIRNYIFNAWKKVCVRYGYSEYDGPFLELFDIYAAKSGSELVNEQLYSFTDRGGRKIAIRPEMTPTLARMVANKFNELVRPIRWFSIANFWRYEKPQRGRGREFFQLNLDVFGIEGVEADLEIISTAIDILKEFGATTKMFEVRINNRRLADDIYKELGFTSEQIPILNKALDKKSKISQEEFEKWLVEDAKATLDQIKNLNEFIKEPMKLVNKIKESSTGSKEISKLLNLVETAEIKDYVRYDPTTMRGLDYYTGNVFEVFDLNPENPRAIAGGGRYDDLVTIFKGEKLTGTGYAMGDMTLKDFLETWKLMPEFDSGCDYLVTLWPGNNPKYLEKTLMVAKKLRKLGFNTQTWLEQNTKLDKQLKYADKMGIKNVVIIGEEETKNDTVTVKNMKTGDQKNIKENELNLFTQTNTV